MMRAICDVTSASEVGLDQSQRSAVRDRLLMSARDVALDNVVIWIGYNFKPRSECQLTMLSLSE